MVLYGTSRLTRREDIYGLLARGAAEHWGLDALPQLERRPGGKPWFPQNPELCFNLSHSGSWGLCGLSGQEVGVDIQALRPWRSSLLERSCTMEERSWLREREDAPEFFALLWALKESRCKQSGAGLSYPPSRIEVPLPQDLPACGGSGLLQWRGLYFRTYTGAGWGGAACALEPPPEHIIWID